MPCARCGRMSKDDVVVNHELVGSDSGWIVLLAIGAVVVVSSSKVKRLSAFSQRTLAVLAFLVLWEVSVKAGLLWPAPIPLPSSVFLGLVRILQLEKFWEHALVSISRVGLGYALALAVAIPLGFVIGWFEAVDRILDPALQTMRQVPPFALYPAFILFFGIGEFPKILLIMLAAFWWILLNTITAVKNVDPMLVKLARSLDVSRLEMLWKVVLPTAMPMIVTGMRYASTEVVLALVTVEMMGAYRGLGILLGTPNYWAVLFFMTILGVIANYILLLLERRFNRGLG